MKILVIAGFLGSGKTTILLEVARRIADSGKRIAIIENEIGEIGIDGQYIRQAGLEVQEIFGGCICCTLAVNLVTTIQQVEIQVDPDLIIIEPTGLAKPGDAVETIQKHLSHIRDITVICLIDAMRFDMLNEMLNSLLVSQIEAADIIAVNKIDEVENKSIDSVLKKINMINSDVPVFTISAKQRTNVSAMMKGLL
jgi:G3E family GTPase